MAQLTPDDTMADFFDFSAGSISVPDESLQMQMQLDEGDFFADLSGTPYDPSSVPICTLHPGEE
jgi:hypothetical protein